MKYQERVKWENERVNTHGIWWKARQGSQNLVAICTLTLRWNLVHFWSQFSASHMSFWVSRSHYKEKGHCWHILSLLKVVYVNIFYLNGQL